MRVSIILVLPILLTLTMPDFIFAETLDVQIKGIDDGIKTSKQMDYKEAVIFAKREAIERAGVKIKSMTSIKNMMLESDYIETQAEAILLPGYNILDMGYSANGTYQVVLIGKVKTTSEGLSSKELRYAKSLVNMGDKVKAGAIVENIINSSKDDNAIAEAMYCQILWGLTPDDRERLEMLKVYYPNYQHISKLESIVNERERANPLLMQRRKEESDAKRKMAELEKKLGRIIDHDGQYIKYESGVVYDKKTGLMWAHEDNGETVTWDNAKRYCEDFNLGEYTDWRIPTWDELDALFNPNENGYIPKHITEWKVYLTGLIHLSTPFIWSSERFRDTDGYFIVCFNREGHGGKGTKHRSKHVDNMRVLPVRKNESEVSHF